MPDTRKLLSKGRYAIYEADNGDGVIAYRPEGQQKDSHQVVPARFWGVAAKILRGEDPGLSPGALMKLLVKR